jgi:uncharacterized protein (DUF58 family)
MSRLFADEFVHAVCQLRIAAKQVPPGGRHAEHRSREAGSGMEFRDFRSYVPGDDLRRVDWNVYRRSGRLFLRLFEETEDLPLYVLLDISDSMYFETPPRADAARQMAGALAAISLSQLDRTSIHPFGADLGEPMSGMAGKPGLMRALAYLEELPSAGPTDLVKSLGRFASYPHRSGLAVVISDFFDPQGIDAVIEALRRLRHRLLLVQVVRRSDAEPTLEGELTLVDCESASEVDVMATPAVRERYRRAYQRFCDRLLGFAARRRAAHLALDADESVLDQLKTLFPNRVLVT